jgi:hypothetical protein
MYILDKLIQLPEDAMLAAKSGHNKAQTPNPCRISRLRLNY